MDTGLFETISIISMSRTFCQVNPLNPNVLSKRYATNEINNIFSDEGKVGFERDLWISVLRAQIELGSAQ